MHCVVGRSCLYTLNYYNLNIFFIVQCVFLVNEVPPPHLYILILFINRTYIQKFHIYERLFVCNVIHLSNSM